MAWSWQLPDWPEFTWDKDALRSAEAQFLRQSGVVMGAQSHLLPEGRSLLSIELMSSEALGTARIEGESLERSSLQASFRRHLGLASGRRSGAAESGMAEMMIDLYAHAATRLSEATLFRWHELLMSGRWDLSAVGYYRCHDEPMQIVSGPLGRERVHYEAPPSRDVPRHMAAFLDWLNNGSTDLAPVARAGVAHLWFETIHPFEDGNGRLGRAVIEKVLAQGADMPLVTGISGAILRRRKEYYARLGASNRSLDITPWLRWFSQVVLEAQQRTLAQVSFAIEKGRLLSRLAPVANPRQTKAILRMLDEGIDGFKGGLSAANYMRITGASVSTTTRDLSGLVELGALRRTGERKATRYHLVLPGVFADKGIVRISSDGDPDPLG